MTKPERNPNTEEITYLLAFVLLSSPARDLSEFDIRHSDFFYACPAL